MSYEQTEHTEEWTFKVSGEQPVESISGRKIDVDFIRVKTVNGKLDFGVAGSGFIYNQNGKLGKKRDSLYFVEERGCPAFVLDILEEKGLKFEDDEAAQK